MKKYILGISLMIAVIIVAVAACSKSDSTNTPTKPTPTNPTNPTGSSADAIVSIKNFAFSPASVSVKAGGTVEWKNIDTSPHTATDNGSAFDSGTINVNASYTHKFDTPGTYTYHCTFHSMMTNATVVVTQ